MEQKTLFNIPFWEMQTINFKKKKKDIVKLLKKYPEEKKEFQDFYTNRQINTKGLVEGFADIIKEELTLLAEKSFQRDIGITDCWSLSYDKNDHHLPHNHSSTGLSGILYLDLPKESPVTTYIQPWNCWIDDVTLYHSIPITEGTIIIAPSFVLHFSAVNKSKDKKRVISWDMKIQ